MRRRDPQTDWQRQGLRERPPTRVDGRGAGWRRMTRARASAPIVILAVSTVMGFLGSNASVLAYDADMGYGPLAHADLPFVDRSSWAPAILGLLVLAAATWRLGFRGAMIAMFGFGIGGPISFGILSPWSAEPPERLGCCDAVRPMQALSSAIAAVSLFLVVPAATLAIRRIWRRFHPVATLEPGPSSAMTYLKPADRSTPVDAGGVQLLVLLGWMPTGITAIFAGVIVGLLTGNVSRAAGVVVGGTLLGWIAMLLLVFTVGNWLEQDGLLPRSGLFEAISVVFGVVVTIVFAVSIA